MNISAAVRIPRDGEFLFFGKFLDGIDSDISMHKRAREVAGRIAKPRFCNASRRQRFRSATSFSSRGRVQSFRARGRGFRRPVRGRGAACGRATSVWSAASASSRKWLILGSVSGVWRSSSRGPHFPFFFVGTWLAVTFVAVVLFVVQYGFQFSV